LYANLTSNGDPAPLPYLPLVNPLDLAEALVFTVLASWVVMVRRLGYAGALSESPTPAYAFFGGTAFVWANGVLLRTAHHWAGVPFDLEAMARSVLVQAALSIFWTLLALALTVAATRRGWRDLWLVGAGLLTVVVGKLFLVDLSHISGVERIVTFVGVGLLM